MFVANAVRALSAHHDVTIITSADSTDYYERLNAKTIPLKLMRKPNFSKDISALISLIIIIFREKPNTVHTMTPKGGLLGQLAAFIVGVPVRYHTYTGQVWAEKSGVFNYILKMFDKLLSKLASQCFCDSKEQALFLNRELSINRPFSQIKVTGCGSLGGVEIKKYKKQSDFVERVKRELELTDAVIITYIARKTADKGANDALSIFKEVIARGCNAHLLFLGPEEERLNDNSVKILNDYGERITNKNCHVDDLYYLQATDILILPSYREGFGSIVIKAASCGIPTIGYDIYGLRSSISEVNGVRCPTGKKYAFIDTLENAIQSSSSRWNIAEMRKHAEAFSEERFIDFWLEIHA
jgi:glycosyltransferase involved in cell wall biosynthesis